MKDKILWALMKLGIGTIAILLFAWVVNILGWKITQPLWVIFILGVAFSYTMDLIRWLLGKVFKKP